MAGGSNGWVFKLNGVSPPVGADAVTLKDGDRVLWYWATFGPTGGPPTLVLQAAKKRGCYRVLAQDDNGKTKAARGARLHAGGRSVLARTGACVPRSSQGPRDGDAHGRGALERAAVKRFAALAAASRSRWPAAARERAAPATRPSG